MDKNFQELLKALQETTDEVEATLAKAAPPATPAAAAPAADSNPEDEAEGDDDQVIEAAAEEGAAKPAADDKAPVFGKSMTATDAEGNEVDAVDATELVKSIMERQDATDANLTKAMGTMLNLVQKQGDLIKSLSSQIESLGGQGRGRKTVLTITEKPAAGTLAKSSQEPEQLTADTLMAKGNAAFDAGKITGRELTGLDVALRQGLVPDTSLVQRILSA